MHSFSITAVAMVVFAESAYTASEADNSVTVGVALGPETVLDPNLSVGVRIRAIQFGQLAINTYLYCTKLCYHVYTFTSMNYNCLGCEQPCTHRPR